MSKLLLSALTGGLIGWLISALAGFPNPFMILVCAGYGMVVMQVFRWRETV